MESSPRRGAYYARIASAGKEIIRRVTGDVVAAPLCPVNFEMVFRLNGGSRPIRASFSSRS